jgi:hypothetical protein
MTEERKMTKAEWLKEFNEEMNKPKTIPQLDLTKPVICTFNRLVVDDAPFTSRTWATPISIPYCDHIVCRNGKCTACGIKLDPFGPGVYSNGLKPISDEDMEWFRLHKDRIKRLID